MAITQEKLVGKGKIVWLCSASANHSEPGANVSPECVGEMRWGTDSRFLFSTWMVPVVSVALRPTVTAHSFWYCPLFPLLPTTPENYKTDEKGWI